jgi:serine/threonine-protein kinase HipA
MAHEIEVRLFGKPVGLLSLVAGRLNFQYAENWLAQEAGLSIAQTKKRVLRMAQELPQVARQLQALSSFAGQPIVNKIIALIEQRSALIVRRMLEVEGEV